MKKIVLILVLFTFYISNVKAFDINVGEIKIDSRSSVLTSNLSKTYKIDTEEFDNKIVADESVVEFSKELVSISLGKESIQDKKSKLTDYLYISEDNGIDTLNGSLFIQLYAEQLEKDNIEATRIRDIQTVLFNDNDIMSFVYLADAKVNGEEKDVIMVFWLKGQNGNFRLYYPWVKKGDDLTEYFKKVVKNEDSGQIIGESYNQVSLNNGENVTIPEELLNNIYNDNIDRVVQLTGMSGNGSNAYGSGFFLREGVVVTTWSLFLQFLTESDYIYVNDAYGNSYDILGVVAAQVDYDVVVLKISGNVGKGVKLGDSKSLKTDDRLFMINSKNNSGFSINYGSFMTLDKGRLKNMFLLNNSDVGGALFNSNGEVVGINTSSQLNSELSYANSTDYLKQLQTILNNQNYRNITYTILETFKQSYYYTLEEEKEYNKIDEDVWNKYKSIGNIEETLKLPLVKASYKDNIVSLRYKVGVDNKIDSIYLVSNYVEELVKSGYKITYEDKNKKIYKNDKYKIIIKNNLNYIIILIMEN